jgi:anthranilate synthase/aminodeoxychorismate synthase-like glutamine amidotransferase
MVLVIDNYDSFTYNLVHLVGRRTDDLQVVRNDALDLDDIRALAPDGVLISPGPGRPADAGITEPVIEALSDTTPILGVCLGHQAIGEVFGGTVTNAPELMHGKTSTVRHDGQTVYQGLEQDFEATRYHSLIVDRDSLPTDALEVSAVNDDGLIMGMRHRTRPVEGIQFHPESVMTKAGPRIIDNWLDSILETDRPATPA